MLFSILSWPVLTSVFSSFNCSTVSCNAASIFIVCETRCNGLSVIKLLWVL
jgi:hypothetical protein